MMREGLFYDNKADNYPYSCIEKTGAASYRIYIKQADGTYKQLKTTTATSYTTAAAKKGKTYSYKVRAVTSINKNATSAYSAIYETVKSIVFNAAFEEVTAPFEYDKNSDAFRFGFLCSVCQQSIVLSFKDIEQILNSL